MLKPSKLHLTFCSTSELNTNFHLSYVLLFRALFTSLFFLFVFLIVYPFVFSVLYFEVVLHSVFFCEEFTIYKMR